jgi:hypothetical protein
VAPLAHLDTPNPTQYNVAQCMCARIELL